MIGTWAKYFRPIPRPLWGVPHTIRNGGYPADCHFLYIIGDPLDVHVPIYWYLVQLPSMPWAAGLLVRYKMSNKMARWKFQYGYWKKCLNSDFVIHYSMLGCVGTISSTGDYVHYICKYVHVKVTSTQFVQLVLCRSKFHSSKCIFCKDEVNRWM